MTDRGLPIVDGAPACPFVAFEDDRDARATNPDHRHRCYAEVRPAPRALAHQEAYCLSSALPVCPTFQDWARREAAQAKAASSASAATAAGSGSPPPPPPPASGPGAGFAAAGDYEDNDEFDDWSGRGGSAGGDSLGRNPPRNWAAPPPWVSSRDDEDEEPPDIIPQPPVRGGGLAGSFADRLAGGPATSAGPAAVRPGPAHAGPAQPPAARASTPPGPTDADDDDAWHGHPAHAATSAPPPRERRPSRDARRAAAPAVPGPSWERPKRMEAYPTLKTRIGLPSINLSPILLGVMALALAAVAFFYLPTLLGLFGSPSEAGTSPSPSAGGSPALTAPPASPTPVPGPTQQIYLVQEGDTMSRIANRFSVPLQALIDANKDTIPNPDVLEIGQEVIIPTSAPTSLPDAGASPAPSAVP